MEEQSQEYTNQRVPEDKTVGWLRVGLIAAMVAFSLPTFLAGVEIAARSSGWNTLTAIIAGSLILTVIGSITGTIGIRTRLSSYLLIQVAFGVQGAALVNLAFAISLLGWFGVNIDLFGEAVVELIGLSEENTQARIAVEVFAGVLMTTATLLGFRAINWLSTALVLVLGLETVILIVNTLRQTSITEILDSTVADPISIGFAISSVVGGVIVGAVILPDITRFIRQKNGAIATALLAYLLVGSVVMSAGAMASKALNNSDLLEVMILIGLGWSAAVIVIAGSWVLNSLNLYSTMLSVKATLPNLPEKAMTIALGVLGTLAAFLNILNYFLDFLVYLGVVFVPVAGVVAVDYLFYRREAYHGELQSSSIRWLGITAWFVGAIVAILGVLDIIRLTGIPTIDAMAVSAIVYSMLCRFNKQEALT